MDYVKFGNGNLLVSMWVSTLVLRSQPYPNKHKRKPPSRTARRGFFHDDGVLVRFRGLRGLNEPRGAISDYDFTLDPFCLEVVLPVVWVGGMGEGRRGFTLSDGVSSPPPVLYFW